MAGETTRQRAGAASARSLVNELGNSVEVRVESRSEHEIAVSITGPDSHYEDLITPAEAAAVRDCIGAELYRRSDSKATTTSVAEAIDWLYVMQGSYNGPITDHCTVLLATIAERGAIETRLMKVEAALLDLIESLDDLIFESDGVSGLHKNGTIAMWEDICKGGQFEDWLAALERARTVWDGTRPADPTGCPLGWQPHDEER